MADSTSPEDCCPGAGRKPRILPGSKKADVLVRGLLSGFGVRNTASFMNQVGVSPVKKPVNKSIITHCAKATFQLVVGKRNTKKNQESRLHVEVSSLKVEYLSAVPGRPPHAESWS